jgi:hypothetical protein
MNPHRILNRIGDLDALINADDNPHISGIQHINDFHFRDNRVVDLFKCTLLTIIRLAICFT